MRAVWGFPKIRDVQLPARFEYTEGFSQRATLVVQSQMMQEQTRDDTIERSIGIRELIGHPLVEHDIDARLHDFLPSACQHHRIAVESHDR
jgi:hypothetical protein